MSKLEGILSIWSEAFMRHVSESQKFRQNSFGFLIQVLARRIQARMNERLAEISVDPKNFGSLMMLNEKDGITQRELGRMLEFPEYATSRNVDSMVEAGLVERRPDPESRRAFHIYLTPAGHEKADLLPEIVITTNKEVLSVLPKDERNQALLLLRKIAGIGVDGDPDL